jgi:short-subunit dehydrogenase
MTVGFNGMVYTTKAVLPLMQKSGKGHIVNIGSCAGKIFSRSNCAYSAAKAAIDAFTQSLQEEFNGTNINFTLIRPGIIAGTDFFKKNVPSNKMPRLADLFHYLTPPEVSNAVVCALYKKEKIVDIPGYLKVFYVLFTLYPEIIRKLNYLGGNSKRDYSKIQWSIPKKI